MDANRRATRGHFALSHLGYRYEIRRSPVMHAVLEEQPELFGSRKANPTEKG